MDSNGHANGSANGFLLEPRTEQEAARMMTAAPVALGYKPSLSTEIFWGDEENPYWRMFYDIQRMMFHPAVIIPYIWYKSGIANVEFQIKASSPDVEQFAHAELTNFWSRSLDQAQLCYDYGWLGAEASYHEVKGLMRYHSLHAYRATDVWALTVKNRFKGVAVDNIEGGHDNLGAFSGDRGQVRLWGAGRWPGKGLWFLHNKEYNRFYGRSHLHGSWRPWRQLATRDGLEEVIELAIYRFGVAGPVMYYPPTQFMKANGGIDYDAAREKAREFVESAKAGASVCFPNIRDKDGNLQWVLEWPDHTIEVSGLIEQKKELWRDISAGIAIPSELLEASETGSGYSGRMVPMIGYYASQIKNARNFVNAFHWQSLAPLIRMNYGRDASCEVNVKLKLPTELTGQPAQGQPGATPPQPGQPPTPGTPPDAANAIPSQPGGGAMPAAPQPAGVPFTGPKGGKWLRNTKTGKLRHVAMGTELATELESGEYELAADGGDTSFDFATETHDVSGEARVPPGQTGGGEWVKGGANPSKPVEQKTDGKKKYGKSKAKVDQSGVAEHLVQKVLGVEDNETVASVVGAPDDAVVRVTPVSSGEIKVKVSHPAYDATYFIRNKGGEKSIYMDAFFAKEDARGSGIGTEVFGRQVENAKEAGVAYIECHAAKGNPNDPKNPHNGYYTWPRFGFDQDLDELEDDRLQAKIEKAYPAARTVGDLLAAGPAWRDWWKKNGDDLFHCKFQLKEPPPSRSLKVLEAYQEERAARGTVHAG